MRLRAEQTHRRDDFDATRRKACVAKDKTNSPPPLSVGKMPKCSNHFQLAPQSKQAIVLASDVDDSFFAPVQKLENNITINMNFVGRLPDRRILRHAILPNILVPILNKRFMVHKSLFSSGSVEWATPQPLFDALDAEFSFTLDPCCTIENAKCETFFTKEDDGLVQDWGTHAVFMNPPYGREIGAWMEKAYLSSLAGATVVALIPARTDTRMWHRFAMKGEIRLIRGRLKFGNAKNSAPFPSAVIIFRPPNFKIRSFDEPK